MIRCLFKWPYKTVHLYYKQLQIFTFVTFKLDQRSLSNGTEIG